MENRPVCRKKWVRRRKVTPPRLSAINLRLKGAGIFWHKKSAEAVLLLRAYYKAGRWKNLENQVVKAILEDAA